MSLLFNMLSSLFKTFLPRSKHLLILWMQSPSAVILEPRKIKSDTASTGSPSISHEVMGPDGTILVFWMLSFKPTFSFSSFTFFLSFLCFFTFTLFYFILIFFPFIFISWRLITLQYCSVFCHTLTWISHGFTFIPHPDPPSHLPLHPIPLCLPSAPGLSTCLMHPTWAGDLFHSR